jgi:hypothetical protein
MGSTVTEVGEEVHNEDFTAGSVGSVEAGLDVDEGDPVPSLTPPGAATRRYRRCNACYKKAKNRSLAMKVSWKP